MHVVFFINPTYGLFFAKILCIFHIVVFQHAFSRWQLFLGATLTNTTARMNGILDTTIC